MDDKVSRYIGWVVVRGVNFFEEAGNAVELFIGEGGLKSIRVDVAFGESEVGDGVGIDFCGFAGLDFGVGTLRVVVGWSACCWSCYFVVMFWCGW